MVIKFKKHIKALIEVEAQKIRTWADKANSNYYCGMYENLEGWCTTCAYLIFKKLSKIGLEPEFCTVNFGYGSHAFVYCHGFIVDVTSTQFDRMRKEVVVMRNFGTHKKNFWNLENALRLKSIEAVEKHLNEWSNECNPRKKFRVMNWS